MFYYGLAVGLFAGALFGFVIACLFNAAHDADRSIEEVERWERLKKEMGVEG